MDHRRINARSAGTPLHLETGRIDEAEPLLRSSVAELLADDSRFDDAEGLYRRALASDEATYGPDHTNVARDLNNLAGLLAAGDRAHLARPLLERALKIVTASYEQDHPRVQTVRANTARLQQLIAAGPRKEANILVCWRNIRRSPSRGLR